MAVTRKPAAKRPTKAPKARRAAPRVKKGIKKSPVKIVFGVLGAVAAVAVIAYVVNTRNPGGSASGSSGGFLGGIFGGGSGGAATAPSPDSDNETDGGFFSRLFGGIFGRGGGGGRDSTFTVTGIPAEYNGMYATVIGDGKKNDGSNLVIMGAQSKTISGLPTGHTPISNGRVSLPLETPNLEANSLSELWVKYTGNDTVGIQVLILPKQDSNIVNSVTSRAFYSVKFKNGSATGAWFDDSPSGGGGMTWKAVADNPFGTSRIQAITYGGNKFVAVSGSNKTAEAAYSTDGITWTAVADKFGIAIISAIAYGDGKFILGGSDSATAYSSDGIKWTAGAKNIFSGSGSNSSHISGIAYGGGRWVIVGNNGQIAYSSDGVTWTKVANSTFAKPFAFSYDINEIAYGNGKFVAGGSNGKIAYSSDGITWTQADSKLSLAIDEIYFGGGKFFARGGKMAYSSDGVTWTVVDFRTGPISYGNGKFVTMREDKISTSSDGITWTETARRASALNDSISTIAYGNGKFIVVSGDKIAYSTGN